MRISTTTMYETGMNRISDQQAALLKTQQQIATGRRILTPADDPVAAARVLDLSQGQAMNTQYADNRASAKNSLSLEESTLQSVTTLIQDVQSLVVSAGNGSYTDAERKSIATDLRSRLDELTGLANTQDALGNYIFAGYQSNTQPFTDSGSGVAYQGDQGQKLLQVGPARLMASNDSGQTIFQNIPGPGSMVTTADAGNIGSAKLSRVTVFDASQMPPIVRTTYEISFDMSATPPTYTVDTDPPTTAELGSDNRVQFDGMQLTVDGTPGDGDKYSLSTPPNQSIFTTLQDLVDLLETPVAGDVGAANLKQGLASANGKLANALDNVLAVRTSIGSRLNEIDALDSAGEDRNLQYASAISDLQDVDPVQAISELMQRQATLEAAQQSFLKISGLSLFNLM